MPVSMTPTGMPAALALMIGCFSASASGIDTTMASGFSAIAASIRCAICTMSKVSGAW